MKGGSTRQDGASCCCWDIFWQNIAADSGSNASDSFSGCSSSRVSDVRPVATRSSGHTSVEHRPACDNKLYLLKSTIECNNNKKALSLALHSIIIQLKLITSIQKPFVLSIAVVHRLNNIYRESNAVADMSEWSNTF